MFAGVCGGVSTKKGNQAVRGMWPAVRGFVVSPQREPILLA